MPMIETTTIRFAPAAAPARCRFRAEAVKNAVASSWSGEGPVAASMMVSVPTSASSRPSPLTTSTPFERAIGTTSCPRCSRISTRCDPTRPVAPVTAIFWLLLSVCIVLPFSAAELICHLFDTRRQEDVTDGRCAMLSLVVNHDAERLQALIDASPLTLVEFGLDTRIQLWNPAAERIFGWTREEMLGRGGLPMAPPHIRDEAEDLFARVAAGESINDFETVRLSKDGALVAVSIAAAPVRDGSGAVTGNMVAYTDISERKAQEQRLQALIDASPVALVEFGV